MRRRGLLLVVAALAAAVLPATSSSADTGTSAPPTVGTGTGLGFDSCVAPSTAVLRAWTASPYRSVNLYFGGSQRACPDQPQLSPDWVTTVLSNGWSLIPTYVDLQAPQPCYGGSSKQSMSNDPATAATQGAQAAQDAATKLGDLGLAGGVAYLDLEPFDPEKDPSCAPAVTAFVDAWTASLHGAGDRSGVYVNAHHGAPMFVSAYSSDAGRPDDIWLADYVNESTDTVLQGTWPHHRLRQYQGGHDETYAGEVLNIDLDAIDGDVVRASSITTPTGPPYGYDVIGTPTNNLNERTSPHVPPSGSPDNVGATAQNGSALAIQCQAIGDAVDGDIVWDKLTNGYYASDLYTTTTGGNGLSAAIARCDTTRPIVSMRALPVATLATTATVSWTAVDAPDPDGNPNRETRGISAATVRYRSASWHGGFGGWHVLAPTTATSARMPLPSPGYGYCFAVQVRDLSGNASSWSPQQCVARALDDRSLSASRGWTRKTSSKYYLRTYTTTATSGATLKRSKAQAARLGVVATTCSACGSVRVYIGGRYVGTVNLHSASTHYRRVLLLKPFRLRSGTVTLRTTNSRRVHIDGVVLSRM